MLFVGTTVEELAWRLQQLETQVGHEHQQDQLMRQQTTIDADRAARTPVTPIAQDARGILVELRVGIKPETFATEAHEWEDWSFKMRQCVSAVDEALNVEIVDVEANPLRELPWAGMSKTSEETSETACVHVDDAHERASTSDDYETWRSGEWRRFLAEWELAHRTVTSDADAVAAVSVYRRPRSGLGGVGTTRAAV